MKSWERGGKEDGFEEKEGASFLSKAYENLVPDIVRKTVLLGLGGVSMTEEGVRRLLSDLRLPREEAKRLLDYVLEQSQRGKNDIVSALGGEIKGLVKNLNLEELLKQTLEKTKIKIQAEITFEDRVDPQQPGIELRTKVNGKEQEPGGSPVTNPSPS